jgi:hypothetical protein
VPIASPTARRKGDRKRICPCVNAKNPKTKPNKISPMLCVALKPIQHRHIVVSFVMTGEVWLMLIEGLKRWVSGREHRSPKRIDEVNYSELPSVRIMLALRAMRIFAAKMLLQISGFRVLTKSRTLAMSVEVISPHSPPMGATSPFWPIDGGTRWKSGLECCL